MKKITTFIFITLSVITIFAQNAKINWELILQQVNTTQLLHFIVKQAKNCAPHITITKKK